jgi:alkylation response protein AidB-like acyl-CoA dehydrogenase
MLRTIFTPEQDAFRAAVREFFLREVSPGYESWNHQYPPRSFWKSAGRMGLLGIRVAEEFGGGGEHTFKFNAILGEEAQAAGLALGGLRVHTDICTPYLLEHANDEQKARWLPGVCSGDLVCALALTEPHAGSDLRGVRTRAVRDGDEYVLNGSKIFISNGATADLIIVLAITGEPRRDLSLLVIDAADPGLHRGPQLDKLGLHSQDLCELTFDDLRVPARNVLGEPGRAMSYMMSKLPLERLSISVNSLAAARRSMTLTLEHIRSREAFGVPIGSFQNSKFEMAACATDILAGQALADAALDACDAGTLTAEDAAAVKLFCTELQGRVVDRCLQLFGGYGYMTEYPIARAYADARVSRIYGGSSEIMKVVIARGLGL